MVEPSEPNPLSADRPSAFSIKRVMTMFLLVAAVAGIGVVGFLAATARMGGFTKATGRVTWNGEPVTVGAVMTEYESDPLLGTLGSLDENGNFELLTNMQPGAAIGQHKLRVASFSNGMPPQPLVPAHYTEFATTPIVIEITGDPDRDHFEIELEGELEGAEPPPETSDDEPTIDDASGDSDGAIDQPSE